MAAEIGRDKLRWLYETMKLIRRFEEKYLELVDSGVVGCLTGKWYFQRKMCLRRGIKVGVSERIFHKINQSKFMSICGT